MRVVSITPYPPSKDGIADYSVKLQHALQSLVEDTAIISLERDGTSTDNQHAVLALNPLKWNKLYRTIRDLNPDIVHLQFDVSNYMLLIFPLSYALLRLRRDKSCKIVATYHEAYRDRELYGLLSIVFYRLFNRLFHHIIVHTSLSEQMLTSAYGAPQDKVISLPHGTNEFPSRKENHDELRHRYGITSRHVILNFGYIYRTKGIEYVLKALKTYKEKHPDDIPTLLITGKVPRRTGLLKIFQRRNEQYLEMLHKLVKQYDLQSYVKFVGYVDNNELYSTFTLADVTTLAYTNIDQSGVLNWAIAAHTPVIASDIGGIRETLADSGVLVPPRDSEAIYAALEKLLGNDTYRANIQRAYAEIAAKISTENIARELVKIYGDLRT